MFIPSPEFLAEYVEWRQSRMETLPSKCAFDRWYEALSKEHIWHQWMLHGLVKSMDIPTRNTLAHLFAKSPQTEKRVGSAKRGLLVLHSNARDHHFRYSICNKSCTRSVLDTGLYEDETPIHYQNRSLSGPAGLGGQRAGQCPPTTHTLLTPPL